MPQLSVFISVPHYVLLHSLSSTCHLQDGKNESLCLGRIHQNKKGYTFIYLFILVFTLRVSHFTFMNVKHAVDHSCIKSCWIDSNPVVTQNVHSNLKFALWMDLNF